MNSSHGLSLLWLFFFHLVKCSQTQKCIFRKLPYMTFKIFSFCLNQCKYHSLGLSPICHILPCLSCIIFFQWILPLEDSGCCFFPNVDNHHSKVFVHYFLSSVSSTLMYTCIPWRNALMNIPPRIPLHICEGVYSEGLLSCLACACSHQHTWTLMSGYILLYILEFPKIFLSIR